MLPDLFQRIYQRDLPPPPPPDEDDSDPREKLLAYMALFRGQVVLLTQRYCGGELNVTEWRILIEAEIRMLHAVAAAFAVGGFRNLRQPDLLRVQQAVSAQMSYLNRFAATLAPPTPFSESAVVNRVRLYAGAAWNTYAETFTQALGLPALPFYPCDGTSSCAQNDKCFWRIIKLGGDGNWDVYWNRSIEESCPECIIRERVCNPLRIRNGIILPFDATGTIV